MSQTLKYRNLFEVNILHHFFLNKGELEWEKMPSVDKDSMLANFDVNQIFEIVPTPDCLATLRAQKCVFRKTPAGFFVGIHAVDDHLNPGKYNAYIPLAPNQLFRFMLRLKDPEFLNYTALPFEGNKGKILVFTNTLSVKPQQFPSLSSTPPVFESGHVYQPGDMLTDQAGNPTKLFTALVKTDENPALSDKWLAETASADTPVSYANGNDRYIAANGMFTYRMKEAGQVPHASLKNASGATIKPRIEVIPGEFYSLQIDLLAYPPGFYSLHVSSDHPAYSDKLDFYLIQGNEIPYALIEIRVKGSQAAYDLTHQENLLSPTFHIRFRNRRTHWRYLGKLFDTPFISDIPLPLTRTGHIEISKPPEPEDTKTIMLPNPSVSLIKAEALLDPDETKFYSEIHIN